MQKYLLYLKKFSKPLCLSAIFLGVIILFAVFNNLIFIFNKTSQNIVLWVWERPENLYFMKRENVTYAYLAGSVTKTDNDLVFYSRRQPLRIPDNSKTIAVVRIEDKSNEKLLIDSDIEQIGNFVVKSCKELKGNISCQIDFDATQSQIDFYKRLLVFIRIKLPINIKLSITSLVSWCTTNEKPWFADSPIDEIIPMFFRLGLDANTYWNKITQETLILNQACQKSIGISTDEELPGKVYLKDKIIYIFNNQYWNKSNWDIIKSNIENKLNEK